MTLLRLLYRNQVKMSFSLVLQSSEHRFTPLHSLSLAVHSFPFLLHTAYASIKSGYSWIPRSHAPALLFKTIPRARSLSLVVMTAGGFCSLSPGKCLTSQQAGVSTAQVSTLASVSLKSQRLMRLATFKTGCMETLRGGTRRGVWRNSHLISARILLSESCINV